MRSERQFQDKHTPLEIWAFMTILYCSWIFLFFAPYALADPRAAPGTRASPWMSNFFHFHAVFSKKIEK